MAKKNGAAAESSGGDEALETLKTVYEFMTKNGLESVEIAEGDSLVKLVRRKSATTQVAVPVPVAVSAPSSYSAAPSAVAAATHPASVAPAPHSTAALPPGGISVKSPMMGIFYRAPSPSSPPFCKEGDRVKSGQVICMIEAMKVFNEIKAEFDCTVVKCLIENGKPVKAGQDLIVVSR